MADNDYLSESSEGGILSGWTPRGWDPESSGLNIVMDRRDVAGLQPFDTDDRSSENMAWDQNPPVVYDTPSDFNESPTGFSRDGRTYIRGAGGVVEDRVGGTKAWRNNNPGNIEAGNFANIHGAIGSDGRFAIFPSQETGRLAIVSLLGSPAYQRLTLQQAINRYAPPVENDTASYSNYVSGAGSMPLDMRLNAMSSQQIDALAQAIQMHEGWRPGTSTRSIWNIHLGD